MRDYEVVCVDMFQTLVDIQSRINYIWHQILKDLYSEELAHQYANCLNEVIFQKFHQDANRTHFRNLINLFQTYFCEVFDKFSIDFCPNKAALILAKEHSLSEEYHDTQVFFEKVSPKYPICLVSDADKEMVQPLIERYHFDHVLISEEVQCYKNHPSARIFEDVLTHYRIQPEKIIHIGDTYSDVAGASKVGIKTCWLNRNGHDWKYDIKPNYIIHTLEDVTKVLGV